MSKNMVKSIIMVAIGISFGLYFLFTQGSEAFAQYETAFVLEKLLSVDNLAVIAVVFLAFNADEKMQHRALNWGIIGAIVMRTAFIFAGSTMLEHFAFTSVIFGGLLVFTAIKMFTEDGHEGDQPKMVYRIHARFPKMSVLMMIIIAVELTDILFAVDSVPAVLSVTDDRMIALTSNIAAILGLRALFFVLKDGMNKITYLNQTLAVVLLFVGAKMVFHRYVNISTLSNVAIIFVIFAAGIIFSLIKGEVPTAIQEEIQ